MAQEDKNAHWLWLYQPPWQLADAAQPEWEVWVSRNRHALRLQRMAGKRLYVVNAARMPAAALAEALGVSAACPAEQEAPAYLGALAALCADLAATLPAVRQAWALYETLEATAWLPSGMAPEFRASLSVDESALASLLQVVSAGAQAPAREQAHQATRAALEETRQREQALQQTTNQQAADLQALRDEHSTLEAAHDTLKENHDALSASHATLQETHHAACEARKETDEENELLLAQLHQVQEELEKHYLEGQQRRQQLDELHQQLAAEQQHASQATAAQERERSDAAAEIARLTKALTEQQQETRNARQAQQAAEKAAADEKQALNAARQQWETQTRESDTELASLREQVAELNTTVDSARAEHTEMQEENDLLLAQLHHVQEELERYFLANREYERAMTSAQPTFLRARQQISRLFAATNIEC
ncbi:hypothetical protein [Modicisalibacter tunisiensis]|uniref:Uncharacterized protein n=1 Tax=Modicisalibacter tunisiensis TaxID=390637 RepID=A0ABS7WY47_9GAMM|nr:hypothetical protein [Modicisalibacter tunisiensis]MBZ9566662.1 hypothetical protein [Modicisalibacter tunisiensis]